VVTKFLKIICVRDILINKYQQIYNLYNKYKYKILLLINGNKGTIN
jgi:hypothetical protein